MKTGKGLVIFCFGFLVLTQIIASCADNRWLRGSESLQCFWHYMIAKESYITRDLPQGESNAGWRAMYPKPHYHGYPVELMRYSQSIPCAPDGYWSYIGYNLLRSEPLVAAIAQQSELKSTSEEGTSRLQLQKQPFPLTDRKNNPSFSVVGEPPLAPEKMDWSNRLRDFDRVTKAVLRPDWVTDAMIAPDRLIGKGALLGNHSHAAYLRKEEQSQGWILRGDKPDELLFISHDPELAISREHEAPK